MQFKVSSKQLKGRSNNENSIFHAFLNQYQLDVFLILPSFLFSIPKKKELPF